MKHKAKFIELLEAHPLSLELLVLRCFRSDPGREKYYRLVAHPPTKRYSEVIHSWKKENWDIENYLSREFTPQTLIQKALELGFIEQAMQVSADWKKANGNH